MNKLTPIEKTESPETTGFFKRILTKMDRAMKEKADDQAKNNACCPDDKKGKGGKCC